MLQELSAGIANRKSNSCRFQELPAGFSHFEVQEPDNSYGSEDGIVRTISAPSLLSSINDEDDIEAIQYGRRRNRSNSDPFIFSPYFPEPLGRLQRRFFGRREYFYRGQSLLGAIDSRQETSKKMFRNLWKQLEWAAHQNEGESSPAARRKSVFMAAGEILNLAGRPLEPPSPANSLSPHRKLSDVDDLLGSLTVLTLNVWTKKALRNVHAQVQGIRRHDPDVICLQEAFHMQVVNAFREAFPDYDYVAFGRKLTCKATCLFLFGLLFWTSFLYGLFFVLMSSGSQRQTWWFFLYPVFALVTYLFTRNHYFVAFLTGNMTGMVLFVRKQKFQLDSPDGAHCGERLLFSYPDGLEEDFLNGLRPRGFLLVTGSLLLKAEAPLRVRLATTHLNQPPEQPKGEGRHQQVKEILHQCLREDELFVVAGDFNATPPGTLRGTICDTYVQATAYLSDAWVEKHDDPDPNSDGLTWDQLSNPLCQTALNSVFYGQHTLRWRCDYILWRYSCRPSSGGISVSLRSCYLALTGEETASDHYAVVAVYDFHGKDRGMERRETW